MTTASAASAARLTTAPTSVAASKSSKSRPAAAGRRVRAGRRRRGAEANSGSWVSRQRPQSVVPREAAAAAHLQASEVEVGFVVHDEHRVRRELEEAHRGRDGAPESFMNVSGLSNAILWSPRRTSARLPENLERHEPPSRRASSSATSQPTLWRLRAYSRPGLPRPTTSRSSDEELAFAVENRGWMGARTKRWKDAGRARAVSTGAPLPASPASRTSVEVPSLVRRFRPQALRPRPFGSPSTAPSSPSTASTSGSSTRVGIARLASTVSGSSR